MAPRLTRQRYEALRADAEPVSGEWSHGRLLSALACTRVAYNRLVLNRCSRVAAQVLLGIAYLAIVRDKLFHNALHDYSSPAQVPTAR